MSDWSHEAICDRWLSFADDPHTCLGRLVSQWIVKLWRCDSSHLIIGYGWIATQFDQTKRFFWIQEINNVCWNYGVEPQDHAGLIEGHRKFCPLARESVALFAKCLNQSSTKSLEPKFFGKQSPEEKQTESLTLPPAELRPWKENNHTVFCPLLVLYSTTEILTKF